MRIKNFEDLEIWKEARRLAQEIYDLEIFRKISHYETKYSARQFQ